MEAPLFAQGFEARDRERIFPVIGRGAGEEVHHLGDDGVPVWAFDRLRLRTIVATGGSVLPTKSRLLCNDGQRLDEFVRGDRPVVEVVAYNVGLRARQRGEDDVEEQRVL